MTDNVNQPPHYTGHPSGVECIQITEHMNFCLGNAMKYLWRAGSKWDAIEDLEKAKWYIDREIMRLAKTAAVARQHEKGEEKTETIACTKTCTIRPLEAHQVVFLSGEEFYRLGPESWIDKDKIFWDSKDFVLEKEFQEALHGR